MDDEVDTAESQDTPASPEPDDTPFPAPPLEKLERGVTPGEDERRAG